MPTRRLCAEAVVDFCAACDNRLGLLVVSVSTVFEKAAIERPVVLHRCR